MTILACNNIKKVFIDKLIFENVSININEGEKVAIVGMNGTGKSTLLRILTGLYKEDKGSVIVNGDHAMLLENDYLYEDKTGIDNIDIYGLYFGYKGKGYKKYSDLLGISDDLERKVSTYSKGMKRKLSLLIIVLINRDIVFLDEATSGVDPISRVQIRDLIKILKDKGKTIVITSHDLSEIEKVADKVTMIKDAEILFTKNIDDIKGESLEELFIEEGRKWMTI